MTEENNPVATPVTAPVSTGEQSETGWLLEKMHNGSVHYISADYVLQWTDDPNKALRLSRREDAEALCTIVEDCEKIASHEWVAATPPTSTEYSEGFDDAARVSRVLNNVAVTEAREQESPILAFQEWVTRYAQDCGKLSQKEYGIAMAAFYAAHPGKGPVSTTFAVPSTSAAIRAAAEEIASIYGLHHSLTGVVAILSRWFGKGETEICACGHSEASHDFFDDHHECNECPHSGPPESCSEFRPASTPAAPSPGEPPDERYCWVCRSKHVLTADKYPGMHGIA